MMVVNARGQEYNVINDDMLTHVPISQEVIDEARKQGMGSNPVGDCIIHYFDIDNHEIDRSKMKVTVTPVEIKLEFGCGLYHDGQWETSPGLQEWISNFYNSKEVGSETLILSAQTATQDDDGNWVTDTGRACFAHCIGLPKDAEGTWVFDYRTFRYYQASTEVKHLRPVYVLE